MKEMILEAVTTNVLDIVIAVLSIVVGVYVIPLIKNELKPWLEEKRIYGLVQKFVEAAEKLAETGVIERIDKKSKVIQLLEANGIDVTPTVDAFIESCVKQLDLIGSVIVEEIKEEDNKEDNQ